MQKATPPLSELVKTVPEFFGIRVNEEPEYSVLHADSAFEVRLYPRLVLASFSMQARHEEFAQTAFETLANYIFSNEIEMTGPVLKAFEENEWTMSFILPHRFRVKDAPHPKHLGIHIHAIQPRQVATYRFSGHCGEKEMKESQGILRDWIRHHPQFRLSADRYWAFYDPPFALPFMKRNEAHIALL